MPPAAFTTPSSQSEHHTSWFLGAPVTKVLTFITIVLFVTLEIMGSHRSIALDMDRVLNEGQIYRLFSCNITFGTVGELVFGLCVLTPLVRRFEREMGSRRFGTFLFFTSVLSTVWEFLLSQIFQQHEANAPVRYSGPYPLIGAFLLLFHIYTPRLHPRFFGILGFDFSEKAITYAFAFQVLFYGGLRTILPGVCGAVSAYLSTTQALPLHKWELPAFVYSSFSTVFGGLVESSSSPLLNTTRRQYGGGSGFGGGGGFAGTQRNMGSQRQRLIPDARFGFGAGFPPAGAGAGAAARQAPPPPPPMPRPSPPSEEAIEQLTSMGFEREAVVRVLGQCDNNVEVAANRLLGGG